MFFAKKISWPRTVALRLTLLYMAIFSASFLIIYLLSYFVLISDISERIDESLTEEYNELFDVSTTNGFDAMREELDRETQINGVSKMFIRLLALDGRELAASDLSTWPEVDQLLPAAPGANGEPTMETFHTPAHGKGVRVLRARFGPDQWIQIGASLKENELLLDKLRGVLILGAILAFSVASLMGWFLARHALSGVEEVTRTARDISRGDLGRRVPMIGRGQEIDRLAETFNAMAERIQDLIRGMKEVDDNIAHDLRGPIARMRIAAEMALSDHAAPTDHESNAVVTIEECDRLLGMINTMLEISELEAGMDDFPMEEICVQDLVEDICDLFQPAAETKGVTLEVKAHEVDPIRGNQARLRRAVGNLLDNALKYTPAGGTVLVSVEQKNEHVDVRLKDTGIGIPDHELTRIFDRFYRGDRSRSEHGSGLGLSLSRALIQAHGGKISVTSTPREGSAFTISLPRIPPSSPPLKITKR